ncbi:hypothetical protein Taro_007240 [Colocasia esculenta]|uniref:Uncharacterized protein n=1 Tax=Colocasia esculenta TaxID=4460 RepID=A0A843TZP3_COLES|nr:hypothetical protein [Colocasia esculenta]
MGEGEATKTRPDPEVQIQVSTVCVFKIDDTGRFRSSSHGFGNSGTDDWGKATCLISISVYERGDIFFFYRPKVGREEAHSADDVQRFYIVLRPESGERPVEVKQSPESGKEGAMKEGGDGEGGSTAKKSAKPTEEGHEGGHGVQRVEIQKEPLHRFMVMGKKRLPDPGKRSRPYWGFVEMVTTNTDDIKTALKGDEYDTSTRGHRRVPPARALAEGVYRILRHRRSRGGKAHTHLVYKLELPPAGESNEPQESLHVEREGSFVLQIKNPEQSGAAAQFQGVRSKRKAVFPAHLQGQLGQLRFAPADPPDFLNYEGCEFLLISASDDIDGELGLDVKTEQCSDPSCSDLIRSFGETASVRPLLSGTWD